MTKPPCSVHVARLLSNRFDAPAHVNPDADFTASSGDRSGHHNRTKHLGGQMPNTCAIFAAVKVSQHPHEKSIGFLVRRVRIPPARQIDPPQPQLARCNGISRHYSQSTQRGLNPVPTTASRSTPLDHSGLQRPHRRTLPTHTRR